MLFHQSRLKLKNIPPKNFKNILQEISGVKLNILDDSDTETRYEILIGRNNRLEKLGLDINFDSLGLDGYTIKTLGEKLIIAGGIKKGTLYGVYTFLDEILGCKMYTPEDIYIPKNSNIIIPEINLTEVPKIVYRELHMPIRPFISAFL